MTHTILFLTANPRDTVALALAREERAIRMALHQSQFGDSFNFVARGAAQPADLLEALRTIKPVIVHFSGHGWAGDHDDPPGLYFEAPDGRTKLVSAAALQAALRAAGASVKLVVLNACYRDLQS